MTSTTFLSLQPVEESISVTAEFCRRNKDLKSYWNEIIAEKSKLLWLSIKSNISEILLEEKFKNLILHVQQ